jgi:AcrR family transcriptional regulator
MVTRSQVTATTRARLLDATVQALADVSADALTMQMVAERADVALRTVYNHFPSKEALVVEAYTRLAVRTQEAVRALPKIGTPRERMAAFVEAFLEVLSTHSLGAAVILGVSGIPELEAKLAEVRAWRRRQLTEIVRDAQRDGTLRLPLKHAVALAFHFTAYVTLRSFVEESGLSHQAAKELARDSVDELLFAPAAQSTIAG